MAGTRASRTGPGLLDQAPDEKAAVWRRRGRGPALRALVVLLLCCSSVPVGVGRAEAVSGVAADGFDRTVASGLGTADSGGAWTVARAPSDFSVSGGAAHLEVGRGLTRSAYLDAVSLGDVDAVATFSTTTTPTGSGVYESLVVRRRNGTDYNARLVLTRSGEVRLSVHRGETAIETVLLTRVTATAGSKVRVRLRAAGTNPTVLRARAWRAGVGEPSTWQVVADDATSALQGAGSVGVRSYLSGSATATPVVTDVDDLRATVIPDEPPQAIFTTASPPGLTVYFDGRQSRDAEGPIASWAWTFGDGTTASVPRVAHTYARPGPYEVTLTVRDGAGASRTARIPDVLAVATDEQWLADAARALDGAADYLDSRASVPGRAIVLDLENTALMFGAPLGRPVPAVLELARRAEQDGYQVLVAGNRSPDAGETLAELRTAGYTVAPDHLCFRDPKVTVEASKTACRAAWVAQGLTVVVNVGNRPEDLAGPNSGKTYLLPSYGYLD
ncbi:PKD domain-containing protein [Microlunatus spumicola]